MTVDHRPICGAAVPARRDWSLRRAIPMASNPPFFDITTGTAWLLAYRVVRHAVPGDLSAAGAASCRSPFHCVGPGTPGRCLPYLPAVRPLPVLLDSSLFDDRNTTRCPVENLPWPLQSFVDHTAGFSAPVASASAAWGSGPQGVSEAEMVRRAASRRRTLGGRPRIRRTRHGVGGGGRPGSGGRLHRRCAARAGGAGGDVAKAAAGRLGAEPGGRWSGRAHRRQPGCASWPRAPRPLDRGRAPWR